MTKGSGENLLPLTVDSGNHITNAGFHYDPAGNMISDSVNSMTYDAENRRNPTSGTTFTYDGRRVAKSDGTVYWVDDSLRPLSLGTNTGSITKDFVFLGSKRIAFVALSSGNPYYYLSDHLGSTAVVGSGDGKAIEWEADYFPFGNQRQVFTNLVSNLYQFTGYEYDSSSGYNYAVARFEAGKWSRFLSPDPYLGSMDIRNPQSLNRYSYVLNNPLQLIDPLGLDEEDVTASPCDDPFVDCFLSQDAQGSDGNSFSCGNGCIGVESDDSLGDDGNTTLPPVDEGSGFNFCDLPGVRSPGPSAPGTTVSTSPTPPPPKKQNAPPNNLIFSTCAENNTGGGFQHNLYAGWGKNPDCMKLSFLQYPVMPCAWNTNSQME